MGHFDLVLGEEDGHPGAHDFLSPPGFLCYTQHACCPHAFSFMIYTCEFSCMALRVACFAALQLAPGCLGLIAPDCRSWGTPARGTTFRNWINPMGVGYEFVVQGNRMASRNLACINQLALMHAVLLFSPCMFSDPATCMQLRVVLICLLVLSQHAFYIVEQPRQSLLFAYYRWQWLQQRICFATQLCKHPCMIVKQCYSNMFTHVLRCMKLRFG